MQLLLFCGVLEEDEEEEKVEVEVGGRDGETFVAVEWKQQIIVCIPEREHSWKHCNDTCVIYIFPQFSQ